MPGFINTSLTLQGAAGFWPTHGQPQMRGELISHMTQISAHELDCIVQNAHRTGQALTGFSHR